MGYWVSSKINCDLLLILASIQSLWLIEIDWIKINDFLMVQQKPKLIFILSQWSITIFQKKNWKWCRPIKFSWNKYWLYNNLEIQCGLSNRNTSLVVYQVKIQFDFFSVQRSKFQHFISKIKKKFYQLIRKIFDNCSILFVSKFSGSNSSIFLSSLQSR